MNTTSRSLTSYTFNSHEIHPKNSDIKPIKGKHSAVVQDLKKEVNGEEKINLSEAELEVLVVLSKASETV